MALLKVATLNLWGERAPLRERMALIEKGFRELSPDVIALQEVRAVDGVTENQAEVLGRALGMHVCAEEATPWGGGVEGLALLSRHPVIERSRDVLPHSSPEETRILVGAKLATPHGSMWAFTTHLTYRLHDGQKRQDQIVAAERIVAAKECDLPKVWMGDFNAPPDSDEIRYLTGKTSVDGRRVYYQDAWARTNPEQSGYTWAKRNAYIGPLKWLDPDRRIDYIFVGAMRRDGRGTLKQCRIILDSAAPDGTFASDHFGLYAEIHASSDFREDDASTP